MLLEAQLKFCTGRTGTDSDVYAIPNGSFGNIPAGVGPDGRLMSATNMVAERPSAVKDRHHTSYPNRYNSGNVDNYVMDAANTSGNNHQLYNADSPNSSSDSKSSSSSIPTCVVNPTANERGYNSESDQSGMNQFIPSRKQREFIPENKKDQGYWEKRRKNNEAARRSREKRRYHDMALETRIMDLTRDNCKLRNELNNIKKKFGIPLNEPFLTDEEEPPPRPVPRNESPPPSMVHPKLMTSPGLLSSALQKRDQPLPHSKGRNLSGSIPMSYHTPYITNASHMYPHVPTTSDSYYNVHDHREADDVHSVISGKREAHNLPMMASSMEKEDPILGIKRGGGSSEDSRKLPYTSRMHPSHMSGYNNAIGGSTPGSYWAPTTDNVSSSDSNDDYEWGEQQVQEEPLSLVKKQRTENSSGSDMSHTSPRASSSPPSTTLPLKLRHKVPQDYANVSYPATHASPAFTNGLAQLSELALAHSNHLVPINSDESLVHSSLDAYTSLNYEDGRNGRSNFDTKYVERRRKNNEAARKCRENRKALTRLREVKSGYLENENDKLKDELTELQQEMLRLKDMLDKKKQEQGLKSEQYGDEQEGTGEESGDTAANEESQGDSSPMDVVKSEVE